MYSRDCVLLFPVARCNRGLEKGRGQGERERLCNPARFTYHVLRRNETSIELRTCCSELMQQGALTSITFSAIAREFPAEPTSVARLYKVVILVKIRLLAEFNSNGNRRINNVGLHSQRSDLSENHYVATANSSLKKSRNYLIS